MDGCFDNVIYITGATGFIGSLVARRLLERGDSVRCLVRQTGTGTGTGIRRRDYLLKMGAEIIEGDVTDSVVHERGMQGVGAAIHLAAIYDIGIVDAKLLERTNVEGTRAFLRATATTGILRSIYISTTVALGPSPIPSEPTEAYDGPYHSVYHRTKAEAHRHARAAQNNGLPLIIICPSFVYGPGDEGPAGHFISDVVHGKLPALLSKPAWFSYVFVEDVANGIIAALDQGGAGETYVLSGEIMSMNDFAQHVAQAAGVKAPRLRLPITLARPVAGVLDALSRVTRIRFPITSEAVRTTSVDKWLHTHERARRDLGYGPRTVNEGMQQTVGHTAPAP